MNAVETRGCRSCNIQVFVRPECKMISRDGRLKSGEYIDLPGTADLEDCAAAVAHVEVFVRVERDPCRYAHPLYINRHVARWGHLIDDSVVAARYVQQP